VQATQPSNFRN